MPDPVDPKPPVDLSEVEAALDPHAGHRAADVTNEEVATLAQAYREAVGALERIGMGSRTANDFRCDWCGSDIGNHAETPGHRAHCPVARARATLASLAAAVSLEPQERTDGE